MGDSEGKGGGGGVRRGAGWGGGGGRRRESEDGGKGAANFWKLLVEVLLYVRRNRGFIRDVSPGRPPRLSHSS